MHLLQAPLPLNATRKEMCKVIHGIVDRDTFDEYDVEELIEESVDQKDEPGFFESWFGGDEEESSVSATLTDDDGSRDDSGVKYMSYTQPVKPAKVVKQSTYFVVQQPGINWQTGARPKLAQYLNEVYIGSGSTASTDYPAEEQFEFPTSVKSKIRAGLERHYDRLKRAGIINKYRIVTPETLHKNYMTKSKPRGQIQYLQERRKRLPISLFT